MFFAYTCDQNVCDKKPGTIAKQEESLQMRPIETTPGMGEEG
jgi:hypothetical protein